MSADHKNHITNKGSHVKFIKNLLNDIKALEYMLDHGMIEKGITRIGAEQEICLVNDRWRPAKNSNEVLDAINDPHFTTELARYNLEINLDPIELKQDCFSKVENQLRTLMDKAQQAAESCHTKTLITGILPTITKKEMGFDYMTPSPRYLDINQATKNLKGGDFELRIRGIDELSITHDSVLAEACNTSFQMHLQISPDDFISSYNWAQVISGPVLSVCTNSPLLLGKELWSETRIALFQQSIDTRNASYALKDRQARVTIGNQWASGNAADIFKNDAALYEMLITPDTVEDSLLKLQNGETPELAALKLHNSTIYRWNRACYGINEGNAHLRIENRYIPAGPSIIDQMANFAFWVGLMMGRPSDCDDIASNMDFRDAKANFINAARTGKDSNLHWMGDQVPVRELVTRELLPIAYAGLKKAGVDKEDRERLLRVIDKRTHHMTGSKWMIRNYRELRKKIKQDDALLALNRAIYENQQTSLPVYQWPMIQYSPDMQENAHLVGHIMSTRLFIVNENDMAELATSVMDWKKIQHVPVENNSGHLCGLLTRTHMDRFQKREKVDEDATVGDIMTRDVITVQPETEISKAIQLMKKLEYGCMPVVHGNHVVGIITISDVLPFDQD